MTTKKRLRKFLKIAVKRLSVLRDQRDQYRRNERTLLAELRKVRAQREGVLNERNAAFDECDSLRRQLVAARKLCDDATSLARRIWRNCEALQVENENLKRQG